jgi:ribonuclease J
MIAMCKPHYFMPVHGEAVHLRAHAKLAEQMGIPKDHIFIANNGDTLQMVGGKVSWGKPVESGVVYVDGLNVTDADPVVLRDRQKLGEDGIVTCVVAISKRNRRSASVEISARGVAYAQDDKLLSEAQDSVRVQIDRNLKSDGANMEQLRRSVRGGLSNFLWSKTHTRPMVIPVVMEV